MVGTWCCCRKQSACCGVDGDEDAVVLGQLRAGGDGRPRSDGVHGHQVRHQLAAVDAALRVQVRDDRVVGVGKAALVQGDAELPDGGQVDIRDPDPDGRGRDALGRSARRSRRRSGAADDRHGTEQQCADHRCDKALSHSRSPRNEQPPTAAPADTVTHFPGPGHSRTRSPGGRPAQVVATSSSSPRAVRSPSVRSAK